MNKDVTVTNMQVKAKAEGGLLINEVKDASDTHWDDEATANNLPGTALYPTSTTSGANWFHANSKKANDEAGGDENNVKSANLSATGYEQLTLDNQATAASAGSQAENVIYYKNNDGTAGYAATNSTDAAYYVMYKYYLRVSNDSGLTLAKTANAQNVAIKQVDVTLPSTVGSANLDKALRVGVKIGGKMYIYAPVYGDDTTSDPYYACTAISGTGTSQTITNTKVIPYAKNVMTYTALTSLPGTTGDGTEVDIYLWFEGEDDFCQSDMITASLDDIKVNVVFSLDTITTAPATVTTNEF